MGPSSEDCTQEVEGCAEMPHGWWCLLRHQHPQSVITPLGGLQIQDVVEDGFRIAPAVDRLARDSLTGRAFAPLETLTVQPLVFRSHALIT